MDILFPNFFNPMNVFLLWNRRYEKCSQIEQFLKFFWKNLQLTAVKIENSHQFSYFINGS